MPETDILGGGMLESIFGKLGIALKEGKINQRKFIL